MRLSLKFTLTFLLGMGLVLTVFSYLRFDRESALFEDDFRKDHESMGRDLAAAVVRIWRLAGESHAIDFVNETNVTKSQMLIRWVPRGEDVSGDKLTEVRPEQLEALAQNDKVFSQSVVLDRRPHLRTYVPVVAEGQWLGTLELAESMESARAYVRASLVRTVITTSIIVLLTGPLAVLLGVWFVGRPVRMLALRARQIADGDFSGHLTVRQSDELGDLAKEINAMSARLADAHRRIASETAARIQAIEQLRHADRLRTAGQLTSGIAHELGTPLNVVWARAKMIASGEITGPEVVDSAEVIVNESARITKIIRQLLDFARPREPTKTRLDLQQIVEQALRLLEPIARKRGVTLHAEATEPVFVHADGDQIQQVLSNLLFNAVQAMPQGGPVEVRWCLRKTRSPIDPGGAEGEFAVLSVRDAGDGIPPKNIDRVFDPFFTTKDVGEGTGLGLSVALGMIREHGGWIDVESKVGEGACFTVFLPVG